MTTYKTNVRNTFDTSGTVNRANQALDYSERTEPDAWQQFLNFLSDPNVVRGMGEAGAALSSGESYGKVLGDAAANLTRRRAVQRESEKQQTQERTFQERLMELAARGQLLSDPSDNSKPDSMTVDGAGNITLKASMADTPTTFMGEQQPVESRGYYGGEDLPDFSRVQTGNIRNFAGLDSDDIAMLLNAEQQFGALSTRQVGMLLDQKARRDAAVEARRRREEDLARYASEAQESRRRFEIQQKAAEEERASKSRLKQLDMAFEFEKLDRMQENRIALEQEKARLEQTPTPESQAELAKLSREIDKINADIAYTEARTKELGATKPITPKDQAELDRKRMETELKLDEREKDELASVAGEFVDNKGNTIEISFEERRVNAIQANNRPNNRIYYQVQEPIEDAPGVARWGTDVPGDVVPIALPRVNGRQITSQDILDTIGTLNPKTGQPYTELEVLNGIQQLSKQVK